MTKQEQKILPEQPDALFGRVVSILEQAQSNVVRAVNTNMVHAYWLIGREIVPERLAIRHPTGDESAVQAIPHPPGGELVVAPDRVSTGGSRR